MNDKLFIITEDYQNGGWHVGDVSTKECFQEMFLDLACNDDILEGIVDNLRDDKTCLDEIQDTWQIRIEEFDINNVEHLELFKNYDTDRFDDMMFDFKNHIVKELFDNNIENNPLYVKSNANSKMLSIMKEKNMFSVLVLDNDEPTNDNDVALYCDSITEIDIVCKEHLKDNLCKLSWFME